MTHPWSLLRHPRCSATGCSPCSVFSFLFALHRLVWAGVGLCPGDGSPQQLWGWVSVPHPASLPPSAALTAGPALLGAARVSAFSESAVRQRVIYMCICMFVCVYLCICRDCPCLYMHLPTNTHLYKGVYIVHEKECVCVYT